MAKQTVIKINRETFRDKVHACWLGKNIGGTMGAPYEGQTEMQDIQGFVTAKGEILPNDDLDLQLVWLSALDQRGPGGVTLSSIGEYWLTCIGPHWNEYGIGKANMLRGILPPLSGEVDNAHWKTSNGAWIRTEIWAALCPGFPEIARKYAFTDAAVDHGCAEGTIAALFVVTMESLAYFESDIRKLIDAGLQAIPEDSRVAKAVRLAVECYDSGVAFKEARRRLVEQSADIGFFQAPANVAFVVTGLLYGEGDFRKSMILAIDCGDDTDCTGATIGSLMGIIGGTAAIPAEWRDHIGDAIETICINAPLLIENPTPKTATELTDCVMQKAIVMLDYYGVKLQYTDGETSFGLSAHTRWRIDMMLKPMNQYFSGMPYWYDGGDFVHTTARVGFERIPYVKEGETIRVRVSLTNRLQSCETLTFRVIGLPEGWEAEPYRRSMMLGNVDINRKESDWDLTLHVGKVETPTIRGAVEITANNHVVPMYVPLIFLA